MGRGVGLARGRWSLVAPLPEPPRVHHPGASEPWPLGCYGGITTQAWFTGHSIQPRLKVPTSNPKAGSPGNWSPSLGSVNITQVRLKGPVMSSRTPFSLLSLRKFQGLGSSARNGKTKSVIPYDESRHHRHGAAACLPRARHCCLVSPHGLTHQSSDSHAAHEEPEAQRS